MTCCSRRSTRACGPCPASARCRCTPATCRSRVSATLERGSGPPGNVEFLQDDRLVALVDGEVEPVPGLGPLDGLDPRSPARNEDGSVRVHAVRARAR